MLGSITRRPTRLARGRVYYGFVSPLRHEQVSVQSSGTCARPALVRAASATPRSTRGPSPTEDGVAARVCRIAWLPPHLDVLVVLVRDQAQDRKSTRLNSSHL